MFLESVYYCRMISDMISDIILISQGCKTILLSCNLEHKGLKLKKKKNSILKINFQTLELQYILIFIPL